jgi:hypothetical protein
LAIAAANLRRRSQMGRIFANFVSQIEDFCGPRLRNMTRSAARHAVVLHQTAVSAVSAGRWVSEPELAGPLLARAAGTPGNDLQESQNSHDLY